jgi:hypothetical protein
MHSGLSFLIAYIGICNGLLLFVLPLLTGIYRCLFSLRSFRIKSYALRRTRQHYGYI